MKKTKKVKQQFLIDPLGYLVFLSVVGFISAVIMMKFGVV